MNSNLIQSDLFEVVCKCGHVGKSHYIQISFPVIAISKKDAAAKARKIPRVKHDHKDAILKVLKIDQKRFVELNESNNYDPYLHCSCIQDQNQIDLSDRLFDETRKSLYINSKDENSKDFYCNKKKIRNVKKYMNHYYDFETCSDICA